MPGKTWTVLACWLATARSVLPVPRMLPSATATGPPSVLIRGPGGHGPARAGALAQQDRNIVGTGVGHDEIGDAVAVEIGHRQPGGVGAGKETVPAIGGGPELAVAQPEIDQHVVAAAVGDNQVGDAVTVEVG